jgi:hypothetical protein
MQLIDPNHPVYRHLWVRLAIIAVCFGWAAVEFITGDPFWGVLAGGAGAYAFYVLIWTFNPQPPGEAVAASQEAKTGPDEESGDETPPAKLPE